MKDLFIAFLIPLFVAANAFPLTYDSGGSGVGGDITVSDITADSLTVEDLTTTDEVLFTQGAQQIVQVQGTAVNLVGIEIERTGGTGSDTTWLIYIPSGGNTLTFDNGGERATLTTGGLLTVASAAVTSLTVSTATFTGLLGLRADAAPRTNITPTAAGQLIFNSADSEVCLSTAAVIASWVRISSTGTACTH